MPNSAPKSVVLVHGGFVDGSGWQAVYKLLKKDGFNVSIVQNPTLSLEGDAAATRMIIDAQDGPVILVGHSYGGAVITEAGTHLNVAALVYIAAFATRASLSTPSSPIRLRARRCHRSFRLKTASCSWTRRSSPHRSPRT
jgi:pimeloyl-ACP methyl ester carboxylesterase